MDAAKNGWVGSARAWIDRMRDERDFARIHVLDRRMLDRAAAVRGGAMIDIGCGEGRFCRMAAGHGLRTMGVDPVEHFVRHARAQDPSGTYLTGVAERLPFEDASFDLAVFYLTLIDIDGFREAIGEAARVLRPGGRVLIANLSSFFTSNGNTGWVEGPDGRRHFPLGSYLAEEADWYEWDGLRIRNWHRPLSAYMSALLDAGLTLTRFEEPAPTGGPEEQMATYMRVPFTMMMEWRKDA